MKASSFQDVLITVTQSFAYVSISAPVSSVAPSVRISTYETSFPSSFLIIQGIVSCLRSDISW